ncbi:MAG: AI-2E family transporter, partial [Saprospiraceae bacterium]|nr:AI-2E family transporter [Saprospiraceae bacterium]
MKTWQKYVIAIVPLLIVVTILWYFSDIVSYIIMAWVLSMIGAPLYKLLNRFMASGVASGLTLLIFALLIVLLVRLFIPPLFQQAKNLAGIDYEKIVLGLEEPINDARTWLVGKGLMEEADTQLASDELDRVTRERYVSKVIRLDSLLQERGDTLSNEGINLLINIEHNEPVGEKSLNTKGNYFTGLRSNIFEMFNPSKIQQILSSLVGVFGSFIIALMAVFFIAFFFLKEQGLFTRMVSFLVPNNRESQVSHAIKDSSALLI